MITLISGSTFVLFLFVTTAVLASAIQQCWLRVSATQFTPYMTILNLGRPSGVAVFGPIKDGFDWPYVFRVFGIILFIQLMAIGFMSDKEACATGQGF
ncbi:MAG: PAT family beta-lactamase induction signal transducer AmpG [Cryomorphaceae bacterium]